MVKGDDFYEFLWHKYSIAKELDNVELIDDIQGLKKKLARWACQSQNKEAVAIYKNKNNR